MKTIQIPARLPEKQDIVESWDSLTNEEVTRFVCKYEGLKNIDEFKTKTVPTKKFGNVKQIQTTRIDTSNNQIHWTEEFYSGKTLAVYKVSYYYDTMYFVKIHFREGLPEDIGYGLNPDDANAQAYCKKHNMLISTHPNWLGNYDSRCSRCSKCQDEDIEKMKNVWDK